MSSNARKRFALLVALCLSFSTAAPAFAAESTRTFVANLWPEAKQRGVPKSVFDAAFHGFSPSAKIMELTRKQPEFTTTTGQYIGKRITDTQARNGRAMAAEWKKTLAKIETQYGVSSEVVLAIWGMETNFGSYMGGNNTIHALATLVHGGYRPDFFRNELLVALQILAAGHVAPENMIGSWAGAMGHTQFMPSSFARYAVDFNGDGRDDIWKSIPDALASTANYLKGHGWQDGQTWGYEVKLPKGFDFAYAHANPQAPLGQWQAMGVTRVSGRAFPRPNDSAKIFLPAGGHGPAFLTLHNFEVIKAYNKSNNYALAVGHLADRILGSDGFAQPFPANETALTKNQRAQLQAQLSRRGFDAGPSDGVIGAKTRAAIMAFQRQSGLLADGFPSGSLLRRLE